MLKKNKSFPVNSDKISEFLKVISFIWPLYVANLQIEIALCTSDSPIQDILETDMDCVISAPLSSIIRFLKLDMDEYRRLSCKALISIGNLSKFFSITGDSTDTLRLVLKVNDLDHSSTVVYVVNLFLLKIFYQIKL